MGASERLADAVTMVAARQAGASMRFGTVEASGAVNVGGDPPVLLQVTGWAVAAPAPGARVALIIQGTTMLGIEVV